MSFLNLDLKELLKTHRPEGEKEQSLAALKSVRKEGEVEKEPEIEDEFEPGSRKKEAEEDYVPTPREQRPSHPPVVIAHHRRLEVARVQAAQRGAVAPMPSAEDLKKMEDLKKRAQLNKLLLDADATRRAELNKSSLSQAGHAIIISVPKPSVQTAEIFRKIPSEEAPKQNISQKKPAVTIEQLKARKFRPNTAP
jgi:hypothetical protein